MTSERRVSVDEMMTSRDPVAAAVSPTLAVVHADRRSRSVDSGLVTDVDLAPPRVPASCSAPLGSCDSGLPQHDADRLSDVDCHCSALSQSPDDAAHDRRPPRVSVTRTDNRQSWLLRLFESRLFDMSIAIQYLFNSKESGVQTYIGESSD